MVAQNPQHGRGRVNIHLLFFSVDVQIEGRHGGKF
jgi:hypothetical protein